MLLECNPIDTGLCCWIAARRHGEDQGLENFVTVEEGRDG